MTPWISRASLKTRRSILTSAHISDVGGLKGNVLIAVGVTIENTTGADVFVYGSVDESTAAARDRILDFVRGQDTIDLSAVDEFVTGGVVLQFVNSFTGQIGQAILSYNAASNVGGLGIDFNGDAQADFAISLIGQATQADIVV